jgi:hypothetical protein
VAEYLLCKPEALSSNPTPTKKKKGKGRGVCGNIPFTAFRGEAFGK